MLASHRVPGRVRGGAVSPRWLRFLLSASPGAKVSVVHNLSEEIAMALGAGSVRIARDGHDLAVEVERDHPEPVLLLPLLRSLPQLPPYTACLGLADDGRPLLLRLPSPDVTHVLVAGTSGSGKTELMRSMILSLAVANRQAQLQIALVDPKSRGFGPLAGLRHLLAPPALDIASATALFERLIEALDRREAEGVSQPRIVIVVDEVIDLLMRGGKQIEQGLTRIAQGGREAGLHLVLGAHKPASAALGAHLKANLPLRLVGRVGSADDARVASGISGSGAEKLTGRGDFLAVAGGQVTRFQAAYVPASGWVEIADAIRTGQKLIGRQL